MAAAGLPTQATLAVSAGVGPGLGHDVEPNGLAPGGKQPAVDRPGLPISDRMAIEPGRWQETIGGAQEQDLVGCSEVSGRERPFLPREAEAGRKLPGEGEAHPRQGITGWW